MSDEPRITPLSEKRPTSRSPRRLGETIWSERRGELLHEGYRKRRGGQSKWLGLTRAEWTFFATVALAGFAAALVVLRVWGSSGLAG